MTDDVALDQIAEAMNDADWSRVMYDGDVLEAIMNIVALTGRSVEDQS
jgi:hypothetical protein